MSAVGELLELLHTSDRRWRTVRASGREWRHTQRLLDAFRRAAEEARHGTTSVVAFGRNDGAPDPDEQVEPWRLTVARGGKVRAEFVVGDETIIAVLDGDRWWHWSPSGGGGTNEADADERSSHGTGPGAALFETAAILPAVELRITGRAEVAGRVAISVLATRLPAERDRFGPSGLHGLGSGADEYALLVDAERGVLLRSEARLDGAPFKVLEVEEVAFDEDLPPETFVLALPDDETFAEARATRDVPLGKLASQVGFTVVVPEHPPIDPGPGEFLSMPDGAMIVPGDARSGTPIHAHLSYQLGRGRMLSLRESESPMPAREHQELEDRGDLSVGMDRTTDPPRAIVRLCAGGTYVELEAAGMTPEELVAISDTLVPLE